MWVQFHVSPPLISPQALQSQSLYPFLSIKTICLLISHHLSQICLKFCFSQNTRTSGFLQKYRATTLAPSVLPLHNKAIIYSPVPHAAKSGGGPRFWNPYSTWVAYYTLNTKSTWACSDTWGRKAKPLLPSSQVPTSHLHPFPRFFLSSFSPQLGHGVKTILSHNVDPSPESTGYRPRLSQSDGVGKKRRKTWAISEAPQEYQKKVPGRLYQWGEQTLPILKPRMCHEWEKPDNAENTTHGDGVDGIGVQPNIAIWTMGSGLSGLLIITVIFESWAYHFLRGSEVRFLKNIYTIPRVYKSTLFLDIIMLRDRQVKTSCFTISKQYSRCLPKSHDDCQTESRPKYKFHSSWIFSNCYGEEFPSVSNSVKI